MKKRVKIRKIDTSFIDSQSFQAYDLEDLADLLTRITTLNFDLVVSGQVLNLGIKKGMRAATQLQAILQDGSEMAITYNDKEYTLSIRGSKSKIFRTTL